jgi:hypothetical protein
MTSAGNTNTAVGANAGRLADACNGLTLIGYAAGWHVVDGNSETALGSFALYAQIGWTGGCNTAIGAQALYSGTTLTGCVALGYCAGYHETANNKFFVDNQSRGSEANGRAMALLYGIFDAAIANQKLRVNAFFGIDLTCVPAAANNAGAQAAGCGIGDFYRTNADPSALCIRSA